MGDYFQSIVDVEATAEEADQLADELLAWLVEAGVVATAADVSRNQIRTEGVELFTGRNVFYSLTSEQRATCPHCAWSMDPDHGAWEELMDAVGRWHDGGSGDVHCPGCGDAVPLNAWHWDPPWGFGNLGVKFWNWPPLEPGFLREVAARLGHRTVHPYGKL